jgi:glycosyltransferase involved in cell wall biosynthesis
MMNKILFDARNLALSKGTGVATYGRETIKAAIDAGYKASLLYGRNVIYDSDPLINSTNFYDSLGKDIDEGRRFRKNPLSFLNNILNFQLNKIQRNSESAEKIPPQISDIWNVSDLFRRADTNFRFSKQLLSLKRPPSSDLMHWTYPLPITIKGIPNLYTFHDLVPIKLPQTTLDVKKTYIEKCRKIVTNASHILTVSDFSKNDIAEFLNINSDRITNTYQAADASCELGEESKDCSASIVEGMFDVVPDSYYIFFGALEPKKNVGRIIEAYLSSMVKSPLIIIGAPGWRNENELNLFNSLTRQNRIIEKRIFIFEYLPRLLLLRLLRGARALVFPALYEGFGLPVVEAQSLGVPVISSTTGAIPEVSGSNAILVNPYDVSAICDAIKQVDSCNSLRKELSESGYINSRRFTLNEYSKRLKDVYDRFL